MLKSRSLIYILLAFLPTTLSLGGELKVDADGTQYQYFRFIGQIQEGDYEKISGAFSKRVPTRSIFFASPGGDVDEAIKIAEFLDKYMIEVEAPHKPLEFGLPGDRKIWLDPQCRKSWREAEEIPESKCVCASACAIVWLTVRSRDNGDVLIHRPSFEKQQFSSLSNADALKKFENMEASLRTYLVRKGTPQGIIAKMFFTPSSEAIYLSDDEREQLPTNAAFEELVNARCGLQFEHHDVLYLDKLLRKRHENVLNQMSKYSPYRSEAEKKVYEALANDLSATKEKRAEIQPLVFQVLHCAEVERHKHLVEIQGITPYTDAEKKEQMLNQVQQALERLRAFPKE